jgi:hypothetical protein
MILLLKINKFYFNKILVEKTPRTTKPTLTLEHDPASIVNKPCMNSHVAKMGANSKYKNKLAKGLRRKSACKKFLASVLVIGEGCSLCPVHHVKQSFFIVIN